MKGCSTTVRSCRNLRCEARRVREWRNGSSRPHLLLAMVNGMLRCVDDAKRHVEPLRDTALTTCGSRKLSLRKTRMIFERM